MASALLHMNLTQLKNDGVIGMDSEQSYGRNRYESSFNGDAGPLKREHEDDSDRSQVKKRRKQSKPIRIASTESVSDEADANGGGGGGRVEQSSDEFLAGGVETSTPTTNNGGGGGGEGGGGGGSCKVESDDLTTDDSYEENGNESSFMSEADVKKETTPPYPLNLSHTKSPASPPPRTHSPEPLTPSTALATAPDERSWYKAPESSPVPPSLYPLPSLDHSLKSPVYPYNLLLPSQNPGLVPPNFKRIFVGNNENQIGSPHRIFNPEAFCDLCNKEFCNKYFLKTHKANKHGIYTDNLPQSNMESMPTLPIISYFSNNLPNLPLPTTQASKKSTGSFGNGSSKTNSSSMRAFCNICQREFCNKYFVRRHKAKIHGIVENPEESSQEYKPLIINEKQDDLPGPSSGKLNLDSQQMSNVIQKDTHESIYEDDKCKVIKEQDNESDAGDSPRSNLNFLVSPWPSDDGKESSKSPDRTKKTPGSNNSAFCDICCKEYCNKYFLRIHKQKCHGIAISDKEEKPKDASGTSPNNCRKSTQPMPLNLILREMNQNVNDLEGPISCNQCDMVFLEHYLLKIHYNLVHNVKLEPPMPMMNPVSLMSAPTEVSVKNSVEPTSFKNSSESGSKSFRQNETSETKYFGSEVQRLHSMIVKLNQHNQLDNFICDVCNKDFGRSSSLENHIIKEHSSLLEEISNGFYDDNQSSQPSNKWDCPRCPSSFLNSAQLEVHLNEKHNIFDSKMPGRNGDDDIGSHLPAGGERSVVHTPTSSFCEICKKELCNKYFMKTHMQRMHGISIENGAHIGGVVCDICNKELCSKYFLRVHKQNSHGIVEEAFLPQIGNEVKAQGVTPDSALKPSDNELTHRYFSHFTEVCSICSRRFRSVKWLKTHLLNDHGDEGKEKWRELQNQNGNKSDKLLLEPTKKNDFCCPSFRNSLTADNKPSEPSTSFQQCEAVSSMLTKSSSLPKSYQCSYCSFSTSVLALLFVHEKTHFPNAIESQEFRGPLSLSPKETQDANEQALSSNHSALCFSSEEPTNYHTNYEYQPTPSHNDKESHMKEENSFSEAREQSVSRGESAMRCCKCSYTTQQLEAFVEHMQKEHKSEDPASYLQIVRDALLHLASTSLIPASFALPSNVGSKFTMQPFVVEDKSSNSFVSSVVFLPVKEKLNAPVTASFRLTPT